MRARLAVLLLLTALLAGCASNGGGDDDDDPQDSSTGSASGSASGSRSSSATGSASGTATDGPAPNRAPSGAIVADSNGTRVAFNLTGADADGDALSWALDFGDGNSTTGTTLPAALNHTYVVGNHSVLYNLTDGKESVSYALNLSLTAAATGAATQDIDADWEPATNPACTDDAAPYDAVPGTFVEFAVTKGTWGLPFTATFDSGAAQDHVMFLDAAGAILLHVTTGLPSDTDWEATGTVPANAATGAFFGCLGTPGEHVVYHAGSPS